MSRSSERVLVGTLVMFAALGSVSSARQTSTTTENRTFEVVAVNGNALVVREASGTMEYIVPDTFRFTTGGKSLSVHELTPGMNQTKESRSDPKLSRAQPNCIKRRPGSKQTRDFPTTESDRPP